MKCFAGNVIEVKLLSIITGAKCTECGYNCHERCQPQVPWQCKKPDVLEQPGSGVTKSTLSLPSEVSSCFRIILFIFASRFVFMRSAKSWTNQDCTMMKSTYPQCYFNLFSRRLTPLGKQRSFTVAIFTKEGIFYVNGRPDGLFWTRQEIRYLESLLYGHT